MRRPGHIQLAPRASRGPLRTAVWLLSAAAVLAALGVGSPAGAAPSRSAYAAKANAVCASYNAKLAALTGALAGETSITQAEHQLDAVITASLADNRALEAIRRPPSEAKALTKLFAMQGQGIVDLRKAVQSLELDKVTGVDGDLDADQALIKPVERGFNALGLTTCAAQPSAGSAG
jgi:hypothetical protein